MLNQLFTASNFRKIFDLENRKGMFLEGKFFPDLQKQTEKIKHCTGKLKELKKSKASLTLEEYTDQIVTLSNEKKDLKNEKEELIKIILEQISCDITSSNFKIGLKQVTSPNEKKAFTTDGKPQAYFAIKQIQYNIKKLYKVKQSNRYAIVSQLKNILSDNFPKYIIRTDIKKLGLS